MIDASAILVLAYACLGVAGALLAGLLAYPWLEARRDERRRARRGGMLR